MSFSQHLIRNEFHKQIRKRQIQSMQKTRRHALIKEQNDNFNYLQIMQECTISTLTKQGNNYLQLIKQALLFNTCPIQKLEIILQTLIEYLFTLLNQSFIEQNQYFVKKELNNQCWRNISKMLNLNLFFSLINEIVYQYTSFYNLEKIIKITLSALEYTFDHKINLQQKLTQIEKVTLLNIFWNISYFGAIQKIYYCHVFEDLQLYLFEYGFKSHEKQSIIGLYANSIQFLLKNTQHAFLTIFEELLDTSNEKSIESLIQCSIILLKCSNNHIQKSVINNLAQLQFNVNSSQQIFNSFDKLFIAVSQVVLDTQQLTQIQQRLIINFLPVGVKSYNAKKYLNRKTIISHYNHYSLKILLIRCANLIEMLNKQREQFCDQIFNTLFELYMIGQFEGCQQQIMIVVEKYFTKENNEIYYKDQVRQMIMTITFLDQHLKNYLQMVLHYIQHINVNLCPLEFFVQIKLKIQAKLYQKNQNILQLVQYCYEKIDRIINERSNFNSQTNSICQ